MTDGRSGNGTGGLIVGLLGVAFVVLKLCHVIDWSWWWVTAPFWMPIPAASLLFMLAWLLRER
jgi:hypothetical protein